MAVTLHECRIARRGKAAKGSVVVRTFGVPVKEKDSAITKSWDFSSFRKLAIMALVSSVTAVLKAAKIEINLCEAFIRGVDMMLKSQNLQNQSATGLVANYILAQGLAIDLAEAKAVAIAWGTIRSTMAKAGMPIPSMEELTAARTKQVAELKKAGLWKAAKPEVEKPVGRLVKPSAESEALESLTDSVDDDSSEEEEYDNPDSPEESESEVSAE